MEQIKISPLITEALTNPDPDIQYMKAEDLTTHLLNYYSQPPKGIVDENTQKLINECYRVFYQHLQCQYREVQGNAIKQFQKLAPQMRGNEVKYIAGELLKSSIDSSPEYRENYYICLQEVVEKVPQNVQTLGEVQETIIKKLGDLKQAVKKLQVSNQIVHQEIQQNIEIQAELLKILSQIMSRWPKLCQIDFSDLLIDNIANQNELSIRKNSCVCLGYLGQGLTQDQLNNLILQKILPELKEYKFDQKSFNRCFFMNQSLNYLAKSSGKQFDKNIVEQVYQLFFKQQNQANNIDFDNINQFAELLEIQLLTVIYLISNSNARQFDIKLLDQITPLIDYDPLGVAAIEVEENPYEDQYYADDVADSTWRIRRGAVFTFQELLKIQPQLFKFILSALFSENQIIMKRFNEKNNEIKSAIVTFLLTLVQSSAIKENAQMDLEELSLIKQRSIPPSISLLELVEQLLEKIKSIFQDPLEQQSLKSETSKLLLAIAQYFNKQIHQSVDCFTEIVKIIHQSIIGDQSEYSNEQKIASILALKTIIKIDEPLEFQVTIFQQIIESLLQAANQKYIRIQIEGYNTLELLIRIIKQHFNYQLFKNGLLKLKENLILRIKIDNLDQDIKQSLFSTTSSLLQFFSELFSQQDIDQLAQISIVRLQIEALTTQILGLSQYLKNLSDPQNLINAIANLLQRSNKSQIYQCLVNLIQNNKITLQIANDIVNKIKQITPENYDLQIHVLLLLVKITGIKLSEQFIIDSVKFGLQQNKIKSEIEDFFAIVQQPQLIEQILIKNLNKEEMCPAGQIYCSILKQNSGSLSILYQTINENRQLKLSTLRFLHKYQSDPNALSILYKLINDNQDADLAAITLGSAATFEQLQEILQNNPYQYQFYVALKEYSEQNQIKNIDKATIQILNQVIEKDKIIAIVSGDILGCFIKQNYQAIEQLLFEGLKSSHSTVRLACVQSLKYSSQWVQQGQILLQLLEKEKDITILSGIVKALTQNISNLKIVGLVDYLSFTLRRFEERELDFGNFKEKRDDAKDLRSLSFDLLEIGVEKQILDLKKAVIEVFEKIIDDKYDETRLPRFRIILKVMKQDEKLILQHIDLLIKVFAPILQTLASSLAKQEKNQEKEVEKIKMIIQIMDGLRNESKEMSEFYKKAINQAIVDFVK